MTTSYTYKDGRVWMQRKKFEAYDLLLPYGMTGVTDPTGSLTAIREPSPDTRRKTVIVDIVRGEPGLPEFQLETRLKRTLNYMIALRDCQVNFQAHMGACDRPDNYTASEIMFHWERSIRGDLAVDRMALIEGDNAPVALSVPWSSMVGPIPIDFEVEFLSQRTIVETEPITGMAFLGAECLEDCVSQEDAGENGYAATEFLSGSPVNVANVWYTEDYGETWAETSQRPFGAGESISSIQAKGIKGKHRVIVARGTTDAGSPAEIAYADVTTMGTTAWVTVDVGAVDGQYINRLFWLDWMHVYAVTDDGYVYRSTNGGASWSASLSSAVNSLNDVGALGFGSQAGVVWVAGDSNTIYYSEDYGTSWTQVTGPTAGAGDNITTLCVTPDGTVIIGNDAGEMYGSYDKGASWQTLAAQGVTPASIKMIRSWGDTFIWVALNLADDTGRVLRSTDGGAQFLLWSLNMPDNAGLNCLAVVDPNIVYVGGDPYSGTAFISRTRTQLLGVFSMS